jgi:tetratricopeptide (TPR) repeat protein
MLVFIAFFAISCNNNKNQSKNDKFSEDPFQNKIDSLSKLIRKNPKNDELFSLRSDIYLIKGSIDSAINDIELASKLKPTDNGYLLRRADLELRRGQAIMAKTALTKILNRDPLNSEANLKMANLYLVMEDYFQARNLTNLIIKYEPQNTAAYYLRHFINYYEDKINEAIDDLMIVVTLDPNHYDAQSILGLLYSYKNNDIAIDFFHNAIRLRPDLIEPRYNLGYYYQETKRMQQAISQYNDILQQIDSTALNPLFNLGYIYQHQNKYDESNIYFEKAAKYHPEEGRIFYRTGLNYEKKGDTKKAMQLYEHSLELEPRLEEAFEALDKLSRKQ